MHEDHKIAEAQYFLEKMANPELSLRAFSFELSAFLSAARSVLQFAHKEAKSKANGQGWYDAQVASASRVAYFKDKRDISVHATPVIPSRTFHERMEDRIFFGDSVTIDVKRPDGTLVPDRSPAQVPLHIVQELTGASPSSSVTYHFSDWPGTEDVLALCRDYLLQVRSIVRSGQADGYLS